MYNIKESVKEIIRNCESCHRTKMMTMTTKDEIIVLAAIGPGKVYIPICDLGTM